MHWLYHRSYIDKHNVSSVTSKPSQNSSRCVSSFKYSSVLQKTWEVNFTSTLLMLKAKNISEFNQNAQNDGNALRRFASDTAHIMLISIASMVKLVHFMVRSRVSNSYLMTKLCFHPLVHFGYASIYIFGFLYKQCASN